MGAFVAALDEPEILITEDIPEDTLVTPPAMLVDLAAETRTGVTPPPAPMPLGPEARILGERYRFAIREALGLPEDLIAAIARRAVELMPRGRR